MAWCWQDKTSKLQYAIHLCSALAYFFLTNQDRVSLVVAGQGDEATFISPSSRRSQLNHLLVELATIGTGNGPVLGQMAEACLKHQRRRGQVIIFSDLEEPSQQAQQALADLAATEHDILVVHLLHAAEVDLPFAPGTTHLQDSETGKRIKVDMARLQVDHQQQLAAFRDRWENTCATHGMNYVFVHTGLDCVEALRDIFATRGR